MRLIDAIFYIFETHLLKTTKKLHIMKKQIVLPALLMFLGTQMEAQKKWSETPKGSFHLIENKGGQTLGYSPKSGVKILTVDGLAFKDLNKNGKLDSYEDWRKPVAERAKDLASKMTVDQIAGLMLYSRHQSVPAQAGGYLQERITANLFQKVAPNPMICPTNKKHF